MGFLTFQKDADQIYPGWKEQLGYTGESSVQAASFDWKKKAGAASFTAEASVFQKSLNAYCEQEFLNDVGYLPDGTPMNKAGNLINHPETIGPDPAVVGADLPKAIFVNDVGYLPDGTPMNTAGNLINHPETIGADPHVPGSDLPKAVFVNSIGYLPDGTPMNKAGNLLNHPETIGPDPHVPGSPLPLPLKGFVNANGYCPDGTPMDKAGNLMIHR